MSKYHLKKMVKLDANNPETAAFTFGFLTPYVF